MTKISEIIKKLYNDKGYWSLRFRMIEIYWCFKIRDMRKIDESPLDENYISAEIERQHRALSEKENAVLKKIMGFYKKMISFGLFVEDEDVINYLKQCKSKTSFE